MGFELEIQDEIKRGFIKQIADKFIQHLEKLKDAPDYVKRRWVWELLQNAKDVPNQFGKVFVRIEKYPDRLIFSHNGDPFTIKQLTSLIQQVSSKDDSGDNMETTGKFGTGFITTHLLSPIIIVNGIVCDKESRYKHFEFTLDRSGSVAEELMPKVNSALSKLEGLSDNNIYPIINGYIENRKIEDLETKFIYQFISSGKDVAEKGMADLDISLPYTLTFNNSISQVEIVDHEKNENILFKVKDVTLMGANKRVIIEKTTNDIVKEIRLVTYEGDSVTLALNYEIINNKSRILQPGKDQPRLFRDFPLVGSHNFDYPCVLNSRKFFPAEERDSLLLKDIENLKVQANRTEISTAGTLIPQFIATGLSRPEEVEKLFYLASSAIPGDIKESEIRKWYEESVQKPLRNNLLDKVVFNNQDNLFIPIRSGKIPQIESSSDKNDEFWEICSFWMSDRIPAQEDHKIWIDIISDQYKNWNAELKFSLENLLTEIQSKGTLDSLDIQLKGISATDWLNKIFKLLIELGKDKLLAEYAVIPDQNGKFHKSVDLNYDENIPIELKDVIVLLGKDWRSILVDTRIIRIPQFSILNVKNISESINEKIKEIKEGSESAEQLKGLYLLSCYLPSELKTTRKRLFDLGKEIFQESLKGEMIIVKGTTEINWDPSTKWLIKHILIWASSKITIKELSKSKNWDGTFTLNWLNDFINFIHSNEDYKNYLEKWAIVPNQYGDFVLINKLFNDKDSIDDKLKDILLVFDKSNDWKAILLHPKIVIETGRDKRLNELASIIDDCVKGFEKVDLEKYRKELMILIEMLETESSIYDNPFKWLSANKAKVFMDLTLKGADQQNVFRILKSGKDLGLIARLVESEIDPVEIERILDVRTKAGKARFDDLVSKLEEEQADFEFKFQIGQTIEETFQKMIENEKLPCIIEKVDGEQDFVLRNSSNGKKYYIEIKSIRPQAEFVRVGFSQARKAANNAESYTLCVVQRNVIETDSEYFISNSRFVSDIGAKIKEVYDRSEQIMDEISISNPESIQIDFDDPKFKFKVKKSVWVSGLDYNSFILHIIKFFS